MSSSPQLCMTCSQGLRAEPFVAQPSNADLAELPCIAAVGYQGVARRALLAYKEQRVLSLASLLAGMLAEAIALASKASWWPRSAVLVPIPVSSRARRARGHDQVLGLLRPALGLLRECGLPLHLRQLLRTSPRPDSVGLSAAQRRANVSGAFQVRRGILGQLSGPKSASTIGIVLVDDVITSGATAAEAAHSLRNAGSIVVGAVTFAAPLPQRPLRFGVANDHNRFSGKW